MKRIFLSGPITKEPSYRKNFEEAEQKLVSKGYAVVNVTRLGMEAFGWNHQGWKKCIATTIPLMIESDGVALLPNWQESKGASIERSIAAAFEIPCKSVDEWYNE